MGSSLFILVLFLCLFQGAILGEESDGRSYVPKWENLECEVLLGPRVTRFLLSAPTYELIAGFWYTDTNQHPLLLFI